MSEPEVDERTCPACGGKMVFDEEGGEEELGAWVCPDCGELEPA